MRNLAGILNPPEESPVSTGGIYGVAIGIVTNNRDKENQGRIKLRFPWLSDRDESFFARLAVPMAGNDRGAFFLPEVDDEVLVVFEHGDINRPYVIGSLWSARNKPPVENADGRNNLKQIKSRSGHTITLDDSEGAETIEIADKTGNNKIRFSAPDNVIDIESAGNINLKAPQGRITLDGKEVAIQSSETSKLDAGSGMEITSSAAMKLTGATIDLN